MKLAQLLVPAADVVAVCVSKRVRKHAKAVVFGFEANLSLPTTPL